jgi:hypothetical protein
MQFSLSFFLAPNILLSSIFSLSVHVLSGWEDKFHVHTKQVKSDAAEPSDQKGEGRERDRERRGCVILCFWRHHEFSFYKGYWQFNNPNVDSVSGWSHDIHLDCAADVSDIFTIPLANGKETEKWAFNESTVFQKFVEFAPKKKKKKKKKECS